MIAKKYIDLGHAVTFVLRCVGLSKSTYYYVPKQGDRGRPASSVTMKKDGSVVSNEQVVSAIESLLMQDFVDYGYRKVTHYLRRQGFVINPKKVYRLMKTHNLLHGKRISTHGSRQFARFRKVKPSRPYELLEMDIKYMYIQGERRNVFLLTLIDVFSRKVLGHLLKGSIRKDDVVGFLAPILKSLDCSPSEIMIRTDNGSQFIAHKVRDYLRENEVGHEFTHIATPEENGHIEAFHSILERELVRKNEFETFSELKSTLIRYYHFYNEERIHSRIGYQSPSQYLNSFLERSQASATTGESV